MNSFRATRVSYTIRPDFVSRNQANIERTVEAVAALGRTDLRYTVYRLNDGVSFMHTLHYETDRAAEAFRGLPEFQNFQDELEPHYVVEPDVMPIEWARTSG